MYKKKAKNITKHKSLYKKLELSLHKTWVSFTENK
jgi:hypothetical protein